MPATPDPFFHAFMGRRRKEQLHDVSEAAYSVRSETSLGGINYTTTTTTRFAKTWVAKYDYDAEIRFVVECGIVWALGIIFYNVTCICELMGTETRCCVHGQSN